VHYPPTPVRMVVAVDLAALLPFPHAESPKLRLEPVEGVLFYKFNEHTSLNICSRTSNICTLEANPNPNP
jgi:hypothetical protein